jgi:predicted nucleic acid-binding protein
LRTSYHANCFDASALVKVWVDEPDCGPARHYFNTQSPTKYTTPFCYFETLSAMKLKWLRGVITREVYLNAAFNLTVWFQASARKINDIDLTHPPTFMRAKELVERYEVDLSDAFQLLSLKEGYFSSISNDSKTLLVTADERLANAAVSEGLSAWYCMSWPMPK